MPADREGGKNGTVLLTGATGFVGRHVYPALQAAGYRVVCGSRNPERARTEFPDRSWVHLDVDDPASFSVLSRCRAVVYLVHQMAGAGDYALREARAAETLRSAAASAGLERIVYLGGVAPVAAPSPHLRSRLRTGELLRGGSVPSVELRAGMVVGEGSASWQIVRDLAGRLPAMLLPRWLDRRSSPIAIDDVVLAILWALARAPAESAWYDVPGAEVLTHRALLQRVALVLGKRPAMVQVPVVTPTLSSYWIALVTRIDLALARELVQGLQSDLVPTANTVWRHLPGVQPRDLETAARAALVDERLGGRPASPTRVRLTALGRRFAVVPAA